jgi:pyruvate kinase
MIEIRGREIRTSEIDDEIAKSPAGGIILKMGQTVELRVDSPTCYTTDMKIHVNFRDLPRLVKPNDLLYIDDGKIVFLVIDCSMEAVICEVKQGGLLGSNRSIKLPAGKHEHMPIMQMQDQEDLMSMVQ